jgi:hypothetical protein
MAAALGAIALLALALMRAGLISGGEPAAKRDAFAVSARG